MLSSLLMCYIPSTLHEDLMHMQTFPATGILTNAFLTLSNLATLLSIYSHPFYRQEIADLQQLLHMKDRYVLLKMSRVVAPLPLVCQWGLSNTFPAFRWYLGEPGFFFASSCSLVAFLTFSSSCSCRFFPCNSGFTNMTFSPLVLMVHCCSKMLHLVAFTRQGVPYCCTQGATTLLHPACNRSKYVSSKNNKLLFLLYLIFKDLTANIKS